MAATKTNKGQASARKAPAKEPQGETVPEKDQVAAQGDDASPADPAAVEAGTQVAPASDEPATDDGDVTLQVDTGRSGIARRIRAGVVVTDQTQTVKVTADQAKVLKADPVIRVRPA